MKTVYSLLPIIMITHILNNMKKKIDQLDTVNSKEQKFGTNFQSSQKTTVKKIFAIRNVSTIERTIWFLKQKTLWCMKKPRFCKVQLYNSNLRILSDVSMLQSLNHRRNVMYTNDRVLISYSLNNIKMNS